MWTRVKPFSENKVILLFVLWCERKVQEKLEWKWVGRLGIYRRDGRRKVYGRKESEDKEDFGRR